MDFSEGFQKKLKRLKKELDTNVFVTLFSHEVRSGVNNYLQIAWIVIILFFSLLFTLAQNNLETVNTVLVLFGFLGTMITVIISSSSISREIDGIADSLLSKPVKRWEYILSKFVSQITITVTVYFLVMALVIGILYGFELFPDDLNYRNLSFYIGLIGLVLVFFSSIGVMFSSFFSRTVFSILTSILVWFLFVFLMLITQYDLIYSPVEILDHFTPILEGTWDIDYWKLLLFYFGSPFLFFFGSMIFFYQKDL